MNLAWRGSTVATNRHWLHFGWRASLAANRMRSKEASGRPDVHLQPADCAELLHHEHSYPAALHTEKELPLGSQSEWPALFMMVHLKQVQHAICSVQGSADCLTSLHPWPLPPQGNAAALQQKLCSLKCEKSLQSGILPTPKGHNSTKDLDLMTMTDSKHSNRVLAGCGVQPVQYSTAWRHGGLPGVYRPHLPLVLE